MQTPLEELFGDAYGSLNDADEPELAVFMANLEQRISDLHDASDAVVLKVLTTMDELVPANEHWEDATYAVVTAAAPQLDREIPTRDEYEALSADEQRELFVSVTEQTSLDDLEVGEALATVSQQEHAFATGNQQLQRVVKDLVLANAYRTFYRGLLAELVTGEVSVSEARLRAELVDEWWVDREPQVSAAGLMADVLEAESSATPPTGDETQNTDQQPFR